MCSWFTNSQKKSSILIMGTLLTDQAQIAEISKSANLQRNTNWEVQLPGTSIRSFRNLVKLIIIMRVHVRMP